MKKREGYTKNVNHQYRGDRKLAKFFCVSKRGGRKLCMCEEREREIVRDRERDREREKSEQKWCGDIERPLPSLTLNLMVETFFALMENCNS